MNWPRVSRRKKSDVEVVREIALHLEEETHENCERGMPEGEARRKAYLKFGNPQRVREEIWRQNSVAVLEGLKRDVQHGIRRLLRAPSIVLAVVISLGLGIAANVFIFTAVNKLVLEGPPVGDPVTLLDLYPTYKHGDQIGKFTQRLYDDLHGQANSFWDMAAYDMILPATMGGDNDPERVWGQSATANFFKVAELPIWLGRGFVDGEERSPVVVVSYSLWRRHFNGDSAVVGKAVSLSGKSFTVIGVTMPGFRGINRLLAAEFWVPEGVREQLAGAQLDEFNARMGGQLSVIARLKPGVGRKEAQVELDTMAKRFAAASPKENEGLGFHMEKAGALLSSQKAMFAVFLTALTVVALLVLCIACSNVANLLLARAAGQHGEMAVRIALGATRWQLVRPMLLESGMLALAGGVFGVVLCLVALHGLATFHLPLAAPINLALSMDWQVLLYAFVLSVVVGMLCGLWPALAASRPVLPNSLKGESALDRPGKRWSLRNILVVVQISLCVVLLCTTGLFLRSLIKSAAVDPGFQTSRILMVSIDPAHNGYSMEKTQLLLKSLQNHVLSLPGVRSAVWTDKVPMSFYGQRDVFLKTADKAENGFRTEVYDVEAGYFDTIGIPWVAGKDFDHADANGPKQAVANERFVQQMFGRERAVGQLVKSEQNTYEIVGVVKNTKSTTLSEEDEPILYRVLKQNVFAVAPVMGYSLLVHYEGNAAEISTAIRREIRDSDPSLAVFAEKTMEEHLSDALIFPKVAAAVFGIFGLSGLLLACVGLYGVMSYAVSSRTREIGVRLALGATRNGVRRLVVRQGMMLSAIAFIIGLPMALAASKVAARALYGVAAHDWVTFTGVPCFLAFTALIACWFPAQRAASVEPQRALRHE
ncbi:MAG TPA: ABC transporter permease [Edaphobacter sp.]|nr:ABC transporter permease [Edaphobacter sp.]